MIIHHLFYSLSPVTETTYVHTSLARAHWASKQSSQALEPAGHSVYARKLYLRYDVEFGLCRSISARDAHTARARARARRDGPRESTAARKAR